MIIDSAIHDLILSNKKKILIDIKNLNIIKNYIDLLEIGIRNTKKYSNPLKNSLVDLNHIVNRIENKNDILKHFEKMHAIIDLVNDEIRNEQLDIDHLERHLLKVKRK